ncbi:rhomboid-like protein [Phaeacidiphilus oryzae]|uniref:rhomboid-like protein n=1 Tax=Phaeacidiphilus oryzae TaxID=348818 RepID=UPI00389B35C1
MGPRPGPGPRPGATARGATAAASAPGAPLRTRAPFGVRAARALRSARRYVRRAPGTFLWLAILAVTTAIMHSMAPDALEDFLRQRSTNLHQLETDPVRVLFVSALWIAGRIWLPYFFLYNLFHVPAERWLGTARWLAVAVIAHVGATYASQGVLYWAIQHGHAPASAANTLDVGVSYALAGVQGVLVYLIVSPWRYVYLAGLLAFYGGILVYSRTFTDVGHFTSVLLGLACYPLVPGCRRRGYHWDPVDSARRLRAGWRARRQRASHQRTRPRSTTA